MRLIYLDVFFKNTMKGVCDGIEKAFLNPKTSEINSDIWCPKLLEL